MKVSSFSKLILFSIIIFFLLFRVSSTNFPGLIHYRSKGQDLLALKTSLSNFEQFLNITNISYDAVKANDTYLYFFTEYMTVSDINLSDVKFNPSGFHDTLIGELNDTQKIIKYFGNDIVEFSFTFNYSYSCIRSDTGKGTFKAYAHPVILEASFVNFQSPDFNFEILDLKVADFKILTGLYVDDSEVANLGKKALKTFEISGKGIQHKISAELTSYFKPVYYDAYLPFQTSFPSSSINIDIELTQPPMPLGGDGIIYYMDGSIKNSTYNETIPIQWNDFNPKEGNYQFFLHQYVLNEVYAKMTENDNFVLSANSTNIPKGLSFALNIDTLAKMLPGKYN